MQDDEPPDTYLLAERRRLGLERDDGLRVKRIVARELRLLRRRLGLWRQPLTAGALWQVGGGSLGGREAHVVDDLDLLRDGGKLERVEGADLGSGGCDSGT